LPAFVRKVISSGTTFSQKSSTYNNLVAMKYCDNGGSGVSCRARCYGGYGGVYHNDE
jgi:hypothetical protein